MVKKRYAKQAIITRTKNRNLLLERAIKSVVNQSSKDYIHVILNDGGDKGAVDSLLEKYPDENRLVLHNAKSVGLVNALNQAITAVDSEYIAILDDDDSWAHERVEVVNEFLDTHKSKGVVIVMDQVIEEINGGEIVEKQRSRWMGGVTTVNLYKQCLDNYLSNGAFTYRRDVYEELNGYDSSLNVAEDWDFGIRFLLKYDADFLNTKKALMTYHHRPEQKGDEGNSVFAGIDQHQQNLNMLRNRYLRKDIAEGRIGIGYIMNDLSYDRERCMAQDERDFEKVVRIEGHVNHVAEKINHTILDAVNTRLYEKVARKIKTALNGK